MQYRYRFNYCDLPNRIIMYLALMFALIAFLQWGNVVENLHNTRLDLNCSIKLKKDAQINAIQ